MMKWSLYDTSEEKGTIPIRSVVIARQTKKCITLSPSPRNTNIHLWFYH